MMFVFYNYQSLGIFSRRQIDDDHLIFSRKIDIVKAKEKK